MILTPRFASALVLLLRITVAGLALLIAFALLRAVTLLLAITLLRGFALLLTGLLFFAMAIDLLDQFPFVVDRSIRTFRATAAVCALIGGRSILARVAVAGGLIRSIALRIARGWLLVLAVAAIAIAARLTVGILALL